MVRDGIIAAMGGASVRPVCGPWGCCGMPGTQRATRITNGHVRPNMAGMHQPRTAIRHVGRGNRVGRPLWGGPAPIDDTHHARRQRDLRAFHRRCRP